MLAGPLLFKGIQVHAELWPPGLEMAGGLVPGEPLHPLPQPGRYARGDVRHRNIASFCLIEGQIGGRTNDPWLQPQSRFRQERPLLSG